MVEKKNRDSKYKELFPEYIRQKIKKKHNIWKRFMETRVQKTYLEYCRVRNKVKNMITYFRKQKKRNISMDIKKNPKAFWKYISMKTKTNLILQPFTVIQWMSQADLLIMTYRKQIY